jgi:isopentenyl diphosphate isomerase/L-lactate dehydrogenase-like FMN-dependent dehydrogenase
MDIDTAAFTALGKSRRPVSPKTPEELRAIVDGAHSRGLKFLLKGVMSPEDARIAEDAGCDALVVSNHGGRVWEALPGTACVLPEVARSVSRLPVLADGGVRSGADVLKMLALGASAVLIGRPCAIASVGGEEEGLVLWLKRLRRQLVESLILAGLADVSDAGPHVIASAPWL